jgi:hypothetical protein
MFAALQKVIIRVILSVHPNGTTWLSLGEFFYWGLHENL